jgi:hypothetical protein
MKFALAIGVYTLFAVVLGAGILLLMAGKPLFLVFGVAAYAVLFAKYGCLTH